MEALVNDMLKLARLESDVIQTRQDLIDVPRMLDALREEAKTMTRGRHRIQFEGDRALRLYGRETEVQSIFSNLINNAIQYTPADGVISVRWWGDEQGAHFSVADTGIGIEEKDIPRLTERFYRVDVGRSRASGGTGLGLSIVRQALEHHEGRLEIDSEMGVGSTFTCHFPVHRAHREAVKGDQSTPGISAGRDTNF
jgi:two-component system phosphate regulon sensor histidine kinase PhoR